MKTPYWKVIDIALLTNHPSPDFDPETMENESEDESEAPMEKAVKTPNTTKAVTRGK